jgi:predicted nucleic acid-binding protein
MYLLDTCVVSDLRRTAHVKQNSSWFQSLAPHEQQAQAKLVAWSDTVVSLALSISAVTVLELEQGVLSLMRRDPKAGAILRNWLNHAVMPQFADSVVPFDEQAALTCAFLHVPNNKPYRDAMIGASAIVRNLTLVTRNTVDFEGMVDAQGSTVRLHNPYL